MTYSCTDFVDTILERLKIEVPEESRDSPSDQADLAMAAIGRLEKTGSLASHVVAIGNPFDGVGLTGPFLSDTAAGAWAEANEKHLEHGDWWVTEIRPPETPAPALICSLVIHHRHGSDMFAYRNTADALDRLESWCREYWKTEIGFHEDTDEGPTCAQFDAMAQEDVIKQYFEHCAESYNMGEIPLG